MLTLVDEGVVSTTPDSIGAEKGNSQIFICHDLRGWSLGPKRGRPKGKAKLVQNPFNFKLSTRVRNKLQHEKFRKKNLQSSKNLFDKVNKL